MSFMDERRRMLMAALSQAKPLPEYTYNGNAQFIDDGDGNWRIKFLSGGTFKILNEDYDIDVFLVGGGGGGHKSSTEPGSLGGGGGGGGYTSTYKNISVQKGINIAITIGAGGSGEVPSGAAAQNGGISTFRIPNGANLSAFGGKYGQYRNYGGAGGSGGGTGGFGANNSGYQGGSDGSNGSGSNGGAGQLTTTREFGETTGELYAGGGGGGNKRGGSVAAGGGFGGAGGGGKGGGSDSVNGYNGRNGTANTGGGGGGAGTDGSTGGTGGTGGSGIVIIRNARGG